MQPSFSILNVMSSMTEIQASQGIVEMLRGYSIEIGPTHPKMLDAALERLEAGTEVFLAWIPGANPMDAVMPAVRLRRANLVPVPHIGARHLESAAQLEELAARLAGEAGVDRVLIIGGDRAKPAGPYESSLEIMQTGVFQKAGIIRMAIGGFPEGNPHVPKPMVDEALSAKVNFARAAGLRLSIVSQFAFEAGPIIAWLREIRGRGIDVPVQVGLAGPAGIIALMRYAVRCGIGNSIHVLTENPSFAKLLMEKGPEPIIRDLHAAAEAEGDSQALGIAGLHFYVFGGFNKTVDWIEAQRAANSSSAYT
jgi:methylenetetrahydrofolate reductase (NADPH)